MASELGDHPPSRRIHRVSSFRGLPQSATVAMPNCLDFGWRSRHLQTAVRWRGPAVIEAPAYLAPRVVEELIAAAKSSIGRGILFLGGLLEARTGVAFSDVRRAPHLRRRRRPPGAALRAHPIAILRGWACLAFGKVSVSTPSSRLALILSRSTLFDRVNDRA